MDRPDPPEQLPAYVTDPLARQSPDRLRAVLSYVEDLLAYHEAVAESTPERRDLAESNESLIDVTETGDGTRVVKKVSCGRDACSTCPHGPYVYVVRREGDSLNWEYRGRADGESVES